MADQAAAAAPRTEATNRSESSKAADNLAAKQSDSVGATAAASVSASATAASTASSSAGTARANVRRFSDRRVTEYLETRFSSEAGHFYVAARDIKAGTMILQDDGLFSPNFPMHGAVPNSARLHLMNQLLESGDRYSWLAHHDTGAGSEAAALAAVIAHDNKTDASLYVKQVAYSQVITNAFSVQVSDTERALCLHPLVTVFNHSCNPNAAVWMDEAAAAARNGKALVYTLCDITRGSEVCICYRGDFLWLPTERRQALLSGVWKFECRCDRCRGVSCQASDRYLTALASTDDSGSRSIPVSEIAELKANFSEIETLSTQSEASDRFIELCEEFFVRYSKLLHRAHWRMSFVRTAFIPVLRFLCTNRPMTERLRKFHRLFDRLLCEQIGAMQLTCPATLHPSKIPLINTWLDYQHFLWLRQQQATASVATAKPDSAPFPLNKHLERVRTLEPHYDQIIAIFLKKSATPMSAPASVPPPPVGAATAAAAAPTAAMAKASNGSESAKSESNAQKKKKNKKKKAKQSEAAQQPVSQ